MDGEIRLLHVDDDPRFVDLAATFLEREEEAFTVETATSVAEGLELLDGGFDGIISDYDMPGTNGLEFLERVRGTYPDLPFVLFTGQGSEEIASEAVSAGVTDYLQKESGTGQYTVLANRVRNAVEQYRSKRALEASENRLSLFIEQSPLGVVEWNESFEIVRINDAASEILGYTEADLRGESWERIVPESDREAIDRVVTELLEGTGGYHSVNENVRKDGERITCEWHNRVVTDDEDVVAVFSQFQDVTERRERKRKLQRERDRFKTLFENLPVAAVRFTFEGNTTTVRQVNPAFEETFGYDAETVVGSDLDSFVIPDDTAQSAETINRDLLETGHVSRQVNRQTTDGVRVFHAEFVLLDPDTETTETYGIYVDITDEVRMRRRLEALIDNLPGMIYRHRNEPEWPLEFVKGSCKELTGYTASAFLEDVGLAERIVHPEDREYVRRGTERGFQTDGTYELVYRIVRKDGEIRWVWEHGQSIETPHGDEEILEGLLIDISDLEGEELEIRDQ